ncbi:DUF397 domain-containing protein [Streptomyces sp. HNM0645]|uniref:DUF397 domain-containing protein n=1 Tax=Streptomyces sp. HNM0645 TaxID=2782343 RepID=UPI0024B7B7B0|nr:DUF397 domain-containing protein [Streptomyces sp. HNM0645]MDI9887655.1 DUF397 domain-containing protein [Streptomyces sp. HNM0645]
MKVEKVESAESRLTWIKSSYSSEEGGECVEVAASRRTVHVRDSKAVTGPALIMDRTAWAAFIGFAACHGNEG